MKSSKSTAVDDHIRLICQLVQAFQLSLTMQLVFFSMVISVSPLFNKSSSLPQPAVHQGQSKAWLKQIFFEISRSVIVYLPPEYKRGRSGCEDHLPKDPVSQGRSAVEISF